MTSYRSAMPSPCCGWKKVIQITIAAIAVMNVSAADTCYEVCRGTCNTWQDPHVVDFAGDSFKISDSLEDVTLYELNDFSVWAPQTHRSIDGTNFQLFYSMSWNGENITAAELCTNPGDSTTRVTLFDDTPGSDYVEGYIWCTESDNYPQLGLFLAIQLTKVDSQVNGEDFLEIEENLGAKGECMGASDEVASDANGRRRLRGDKRSLNSEGSFSPAGPSWIASECYTVCPNQEPCEGEGDPHVTTFYGQKYNLQPSTPENFTVYEITGTTSYDEKHDITDFDVWIETRNTGRTYVIHFGDEVISSSSCTKSGETFAASHTFADGDNIYLSATCTYSQNNKSTYGLFFDWKVYKFDVANGSSSFKTLETDEGSQGLCLSQPQSI